MTSAPPRKPAARILIVDDNSMGLLARRTVLEELGHQVFTSSLPHEALELCGRHRFDIVVTDYKMPKMDGVELIDRLRQMDGKVAIILISGFADALGLNEANTGADVVLQKSANEVAHLIRAVNRLTRAAPRKKPAASQGRNAAAAKRKTV